MVHRALKRLRGDNRGYVMFLTLTFAVLLGLGTLLAIGPTMMEVQSAGSQNRDKRLLFLADGGATLCREELNNRLGASSSSSLNTKLSALYSLTSFIATYVTANAPAQFLLDYAYNTGNPLLLGGAWTKDSTTQAHVTVSSGNYQCTLTVNSRTAPVSGAAPTGTNVWFYYYYTISGTGTEGSVTRTVSLQGAFSLDIVETNFATYALFTNSQGGIYFGQGGVFNGPVFTNGQFNFMQNPGATFNSTCESVGATATYGNSPGSPIQLAANHNGTIDVPTFAQGLTLGAASIPMPATTTATTESNLALTGYSGTPPSGAVTLGASGGAMTGGIYVNGNATVTLSVPSSGVQQYAIVQGSTTTTVQVTAASNKTTIKVGSGSTTTYTGVPNGMLYVNGTIGTSTAGGTPAGLSGTLEQSTQLTVAALNDINITGNVTYQNYNSSNTPPVPSTATDLMGIISWNGNINLNDPSTSGITITATLMAPSSASGEGEVQNLYTGNTTIGPQGTATIYGGVIQNQYGGFGTSSGGVMKTGYVRNFVYDTRVANGLYPPFFPTTGAIKNTPTGLTNRPNWQQTS